MTQRHRVKLAALVLLLLLPLLVLGGIVVKNERDITSAKTWRVKITGYDPRDLLYGHYLNFRFDWGVSLTRGTCAAGQSCCLCLDGQNGSTTPLASLKSCEAATQCVSSVPMPDGTICSNGGQSCQNNTDAFNPEGAQRYFIPESAATRLNMLLANRQYNLQVDVKITPSGQHVLGDLYIDNVEWRDYLRQHPDAGQPLSVQPREHTWRMKITDARLYGAYLIFRLNWGAPLTRSACPDEESCCALCLSEQVGSSQPAIRYKACLAQDQCLESLTLPDANVLKHTDSEFDPDGPQRYPMPSQEVANWLPFWPALQKTCPSTSRRRAGAVHPFSAISTSMALSGATGNASMLRPVGKNAIHALQCLTRCPICPKRPTAPQGISTPNIACGNCYATRATTGCGG